MFKEFIPYCMLPPDRLRFFGTFLGKLGFSMTILGFLLQAGLKAMVVLQTMTKATPGNMGVEKNSSWATNAFHPRNSPWLHLLDLDDCARFLLHALG